MIFEMDGMALVVVSVYVGIHHYIIMFADGIA